VATFTTEVVKLVRAELKRVLPEYRFQIKRGYVPKYGESAYSVDITVVRGPFDFVEDRLADGDFHNITGYSCNNEFFIKIIDAVQTAGLINPEWPIDYIWVSIGTPSKPYILK
jgi:hypothetical protein